MLIQIFVTVIKIVIIIIIIIIINSVMRVGVCKTTVMYFYFLTFKVFIDATFGSGGHSAAILMSAKCKVFALDRDPAAIEIADILSERSEFKGRLFPVLGKFSNIYNILKSHGVKNESVNGMLLDIGASSIQFDDPDRGFSFYKNGPLDMRMDVRNVTKEGAKGERLPMTAADVVNSINETELTAVLRQYGQEREAG